MPDLDQTDRRLSFQNFISGGLVITSLRGIYFWRKGRGNQGLAEYMREKVAKANECDENVHCAVISVIWTIRNF